MTPLDTTIRATYTDGYVLDETTLNDVSPFNPNHNILGAILAKDAEQEHGPLKEFSVFYKDNQYTIDWTTLPANARPIRFRHGYMHNYADGSVESGWSGMQYGYQYNNEQGENVQKVIDL